MPQAIERSVATPTMSARLPVEKSHGVSWRGWRMTSFCPGTDRRSASSDSSSPSALTRHVNIPAPHWNSVSPGVHGMGHRAAAARAGPSSARRLALPEAVPRRRRWPARSTVSGLHAVHQRQSVHIHAVPAGDGPQRIAMTHHNARERCRRDRCARPSTSAAARSTLAGSTAGLRGHAQLGADQQSAGRQIVQVAQYLRGVWKRLATDASVSPLRTV